MHSDRSNRRMSPSLAFIVPVKGHPGKSHSFTLTAMGEVWRAQEAHAPHAVPLHAPPVISPTSIFNFYTIQLVPAEGFNPLLLSTLTPPQGLMPTLPTFSRDAFLISFHSGSLLQAFPCGGLQSLTTFNPDPLRRVQRLSFQPSAEMLF
jgi:hypothetical protein